MRKITLIVVHCTATRCTSSLTPRQLEESHRLRGFACCGYHYYIQRNGQTTPMRPVEKIGAHAKGYNMNWTAVPTPTATLPTLAPTRSAPPSCHCSRSSMNTTPTHASSAIVTSAPTSTETDA